MGWPKGKPRGPRKPRADGITTTKSKAQKASKPLRMPRQVKPKAKAPVADAPLHEAGVLYCEEKTCHASTTDTDADVKVRAFKLWPDGTTEHVVLCAIHAKTWS